MPIVKEVMHTAKDWPKAVKFALFAIRSVPNRSTGFTPFELVYGRNVRSPLELSVEQLFQDQPLQLDVFQWVEQLNEHLEVVRTAMQDNMVRSRQLTEEADNKKAKFRSYKVNDKVLVRQPGLIGKLERSFQSY